MHTAACLLMNAMHGLHSVWSMVFNKNIQIKFYSKLEEHPVQARVSLKDPLGHCWLIEGSIFLKKDVGSKTKCIFSPNGRNFVKLQQHLYLLSKMQQMCQPP